MVRITILGVVSGVGLRTVGAKQLKLLEALKDKVDMMVVMRSVSRFYPELIPTQYVHDKQALAEAVAEEPHVIFGPIVDKLMRFRPIGWYGVLGWTRYRDASLVRLESTSSIHNS